MTTLLATVIVVFVLGVIFGSGQHFADAAIYVLRAIYARARARRAEKPRA